MSSALGITALLAALVLVGASFAVRSPLGGFKPVPVMLLIFASYNVLPFLAVAAVPELAELMLLDSFTYYGSADLLRVAAFSLACITAAVLGLLAATPARRRRAAYPAKLNVESDRAQTRRLAAGGVAFTLLLVAAALLVWTLRGFLFAGYHESFGEDQSEVLLRGSLSSLFSLLFVSHLFTWFANDWPSATLRRRRKLFCWMTLALIGVALALLSMGGRLYVASAIVTVLAVRAMRAAMRHETPVSAWRLWGGLALLLGAVAAVGVWRVQGDFNALAVIVNLLAEPLYVSISLASLFGANTLPLLDFPAPVLIDAVGLLPSAIYPAKLDRFFAIANLYQIESPVGGLNGLASLTANVGWLGAIAVSGLLAFVVTTLCHYLARPQASPRLRLAYVIVVTFPLLSLCRDPFVISVYKNLLQNSLLWPLLLTLAGRMVWCKRPVLQPRPVMPQPVGS